MTGGSGLLGGNLCSLAADDWQVWGTYMSVVPGKTEGVQWHSVDIRDRESVEQAFEVSKPDLVVHTAALADIDRCESDPGLAWATNVHGTQNVVDAAKERQIRLVHISTSNVFDGQLGNYSESDQTRAINEYARTKIAAEASARGLDGVLIVRTSLVLGFPRPAGRSFLSRAVADLRGGRALPLPTEELRSPIDVLTLAECIMELQSKSCSGVYHIAGRERLPRYYMGLKIANRIGCDSSLVVPTTTVTPGRAPRPMDASLDTSKARRLLETTLPDCTEAIDRAFVWAGIEPLKEGV